MKLERPLVSFDLETTGVDPETDRIIDLAIITLEPDQEKPAHVMTARFNPGTPIPPIATAIHGITDKDVADELSFKDCAQSILALVSDCDLTGYNIKAFDVPMLSAEFRRCGYTWPQPDQRIIDSFEIFRAQEPQTLAVAVRRYTGSELSDAHSALADARAALDVLSGQAQEYVANSLNDLEILSRNPDWIDSAGKFKWVGNIPVINFGKWSGVPLMQVDKTYLTWMGETDFPQDAKDIARRACANVFPRRAES